MSFNRGIGKIQTSQSYDSFIAASSYLILQPRNFLASVHGRYFTTILEPYFFLCKGRHYQIDITRTVWHISSARLEPKLGEGKYGETSVDRSRWISFFQFEINHTRSFHDQRISIFFFFFFSSWINERKSDFSSSKATNNNVLPSWRLRRGKKTERKRERESVCKREKERACCVYFVARSLRRRDLPRFNVTSNKTSSKVN